MCFCCVAIISLLFFVEILRQWERIGAISSSSGSTATAATTTTTTTTIAHQLDQSFFSCVMKELVVNLRYNPVHYESIMSQLVEEFMASKILDNQYNPYQRGFHMPFGCPFHINLNYLFDGAAVKANWEHDRLYDRFYEGPALNRAEFLHLPQVSWVPFDPQSMPYSTEKAKFGKTIKRIIHSLFLPSNKK